MTIEEVQITVTSDRKTTSVSKKLHGQCRTSNSNHSHQWFTKVCSPSRSHLTMISGHRQTTPTFNDDLNACQNQSSMPNPQAEKANKN